MILHKFYKQWWKLYCNICFSFLLGNSKKIRSLISFSIITCYQRLNPASRQHLSITNEHPLLSFNPTFLLMQTVHSAASTWITRCFYGSPIWKPNTPLPSQQSLPGGQVVHSHMCYTAEFALGTGLHPATIQIFHCNRQENKLIIKAVYWLHLQDQLKNYLLGCDDMKLGIQIIILSLITVATENAMCLLTSINMSIL